MAGKNNKDWWSKVLISFKKANTAAVGNGKQIQEVQKNVTNCTRISQSPNDGRIDKNFNERLARQLRLADQHTSQ